MKENHMEFRWLSHEEFTPIFLEKRGDIFNSEDSFDIDRLYTEDEVAVRKELQAYQKDSIKYNLVAYDGEKLAGWCRGRQTDGENFYMQNSAIYPEYRRRGLYSAMLKMTMQRAEKDGFRVINSKHNAANNPVVIAKLKEGFMITGFEMDIKFGLLVWLTYPIKKEARAALMWRTGFATLPPELEKLRTSL